jgi:hypothetical protein
MVTDFLIKHQVTNVMAMLVLQKTIGIAIAILFKFCIGIAIAITFAASIVIVIAIHFPSIANNPAVNLWRFYGKEQDQLSFRRLIFKWLKVEELRPY